MTANQRMASRLNWHLRMIKGAKGTVLSSFYQVVGTTRFEVELSSEQHNCLHTMQLNISKLHDMLDQQEELIRSYHKLPKKESK